MSTNRCKDRSNLCSFMFVDGRHCRVARSPIAGPSTCPSPYSRGGTERRSRLRLEPLFPGALSTFRMNTYEKWGRGVRPLLE
jgi:hypothetical protein